MIVVNIACVDIKIEIVAIKIVNVQVNFASVKIKVDMFAVNIDLLIFFKLIINRGDIFGHPVFYFTFLYHLYVN